MHVGPASGCDDVLSAARDERESVVGLLGDLVATPSRGGIDSYQPVLDPLTAWLPGCKTVTFPSRCSAIRTVPWSA